MTTHRKRLVLWCMSSAALAEGREEKAFMNFGRYYNMTMGELDEVLQMSVAEALGWKEKNE